MSAAAFRRSTPRHPNLGFVVEKLNRIAEQFESDPISQHYGIWPSNEWVYAQLDHEARKWGYANTHHILGELQRRCSGRWIHFNVCF